MHTINPIVLQWARETAGLSPEQAAKALGFADRQSRTAVDRLLAVESGREPPNRSLLLKMAKQYRRSLLNFYLAKPPLQGDRGQDFRSVRRTRSIESDAHIDALVRDLRARQSLVKSVLAEEDARPLAFVGSATLDTGVIDVARSIAEVLDFELQDFRECVDTSKAFTWLRTRAEAAGVFVMLAGNLGSHHTAIPVEAFRGFALADALAPFVVINDQDARTAWSFTLLHELAHLWLGATGISARETEGATEEFCNEVAARLLLPDKDLHSVDLLANASDASVLERLEEYSRSWKLGRSMIAYGLYKAGRLSRDRWLRIDGLLQSLWKEQRRQKSSAADAGGPNYYVVKRHRVGNALLELAERAVAEGSLTPVKAAKVLGVKPRAVQRLIADRSDKRRSGNSAS